MSAHLTVEKDGRYYELPIIKQVIWKKREHINEVLELYEKLNEAELRLNVEDVQTGGEPPKVHIVHRTTNEPWISRKDNYIQLMELLGGPFGHYEKVEVDGEVTHKWRCWFTTNKDIEIWMDPTHDYSTSEWMYRPDFQYSVADEIFQFHKKVLHVGDEVVVRETGKSGYIVEIEWTDKSYGKHSTTTPLETAEQGISMYGFKNTYTSEPGRIGRLDIEPVYYLADLYVPGRTSYVPFQKEDLFKVPGYEKTPAVKPRDYTDSCLCAERYACKRL